MEADVRKLKRQVASMNGLTIEGFQRSDSAGGMTFGDGARKISPIHIPPKTIVIVKKPLAADVTLIVREAKYDRSPPKKCEGTAPNVTCFYEWFGSDFEVYPPLGKEAIDYEGDEFEGVAEDAHPPKLDTVFHRCHREHNAWVLDLQAEGGGGGMRPALVVSAVAAAATIRVQPVKRSGTSWTVDGGPIVVPLWGAQKGDDFLTLIQTGNFNTSDFIPLVSIGGEWYAMQYFWMYAKTPNAAIAKGDCAL